MGAKSCEKSLETFALDHNPAIWSKSSKVQKFANFSRDRSGEKSCTAEIIPVRVSVVLSNIGRLFSGVTQPNTQTHTRASPTHACEPHTDAHHTKHGEHRQPVRRDCCRSSSCSNFDRGCGTRISICNTRRSWPGVHSFGIEGASVLVFLSVPCT